MSSNLIQLSLDLQSMGNEILESHLSLSSYNIVESFLIYYALFCATTAIFCWLFIFFRIQNRLRFENKSDHLFITSPILSSISFMALVFLMGPIFIPVVLSDNVRETFIDGMYKGSM